MRHRRFVRKVAYHEQPGGDHRQWREPRLQPIFQSLHGVTGEMNEYAVEYPNSGRRMGLIATGLIRSKLGRQFVPRSPKAQRYGPIRGNDVGRRGDPYKCR